MFKISMCIQVKFCDQKNFKDIVLAIDLFVIYKFISFLHYYTTYWSYVRIQFK